MPSQSSTPIPTSTPKPSLTPMPTQTARPIISCLKANEQGNENETTCVTQNSGDDCPTDITLEVNKYYVNYNWVSDLKDETATVCKRYISCDSIKSTNGPTDDTVCFNSDIKKNCPVNWFKNNNDSYCYKM